MDQNDFKSVKLKDCQDLEGILDNKKQFDLLQSIDNLRRSLPENFKTKINFGDKFDGFLKCIEKI